MSDHEAAAKYLDWIAERLVHVYGENPNVDFVAAARGHAQSLRLRVKPSPLDHEAGARASFDKWWEAVHPRYSGVPVGALREAWRDAYFLASDRQRAAAKPDVASLILRAQARARGLREEQARHDHRAPYVAEDYRERAEFLDLLADALGAQAAEIENLGTKLAITENERDTAMAWRRSSCIAGNEASRRAEKAEAELNAAHEAIVDWRRNHLLLKTRAEKAEAALREAQLKAADGMALTAETGPANSLFTTIHRITAGAQSLGHGGDDRAALAPEPREKTQAEKCEHYRKTGEACGQWCYIRGCAEPSHG